MAFVASVGGFSPQVDGMLEDQFSQIVSAMPAQYDTEVAYSSTTSAFCPFPPRFNDNALDMLNRGCLLYVFIGHGTATQVDSIRWQGRQYGILQSRDAARMDVAAGLPVMIVLACETGQFDLDHCLGEAMVKTPHGPVAFIGGSRITEPYGNLLLADAMSRTFFNARTLGEAMSAAKADVLAHAPSAMGLKADLVASLLQGSENLPAMRMDVVEHYNLLGDPAMVLRRGDGGIAMTLDGSKVRIDAPGKSSVTLELLGERMMRSEPQDMPAREAAAMQRYHRANEYVLRKATVGLDGGHAVVELPTPAGERKCWIRASDGSSAAAVEVPVKARKIAN